ncbi:MAG: DUF3187 family protein [Gammaproteobacteria bacterium]|nr:DUF3187 family protein [Gammaproteobacteria bacterium]
MVYMKVHSITIAGLVSCLLAQADAASLGLSTRDQNPMLQAFYLPGIDMQRHDGWHISHSLYVTNTFQQESRDNEILLIDVENYRYDLSLAYQTKTWRLSTILPFIANDGGSLDGFIESWHDFFGLPEDDRSSNPDEQVNLSYTRNGITILQQDRPDSDIGDITLAFNYRLNHDQQGATEIGLGLELPSGSVSSQSGNEAIDIAFWFSKARKISEISTLYGLFGISKPGKAGTFADHLKDHIWLSQLGVEYRFYPDITGILQLDMHSATLKNTRLKAFGGSVQMQLGLQFSDWFDNFDVDLFFSEDILSRTAPDITFGLRLGSVDFE